jgi:hypothetical protein
LRSSYLLYRFYNWSIISYARSLYSNIQEFRKVNPKFLFSFLTFSSRAVRTYWGHLVRTGVVKKDYKDVSINNVITLGTRIRIIVLKVCTSSI